MLARAFTQPDGFYIDVGATSPELHSVTKHFYDRGWRGVNVAPLDRWHRELKARRPRDVNIAAGLSEVSGTLVMTVGDPALTLTLADICELHAPERIDFLKVDVEGSALHVLNGGDWDRFRPIVVVMDRTLLGTAADERVVDFLRAVGYAPRLFDGLSRFYVRADHEHLAPLLSVPANVLDDYTEAEMVDVRAAAKAAADRAAESDKRATDLAARLGTVQAQLQLTQRDLAIARRAASDAQIQFRVTQMVIQHLLAERRASSGG